MKHSLGGDDPGAGDRDEESVDAEADPAGAAEPATLLDDDPCVVVSEDKRTVKFKQP